MSLALPQPGTATIVAVDPARVAPEMWDCLSLEEREQARRFRFEKDAVHWQACRAALRCVLGETLGLEPGSLRFRFAEFGKPSLDSPTPALHFNLSHCRDLALIALCGDGEIGVDVERADRQPDLIGCEETFCHPEEIAGLPTDAEARAHALLDLWTAKEALLKALGTGMSLPPHRVKVAGLDDVGRQDPRFHRFRLHRLDLPGRKNHLARVATPAPVTAVCVTDWPR